MSGSTDTHILTLSEYGFGYDCLILMLFSAMGVFNWYQPY